MRRVLQVVAAVLVLSSGTASAQTTGLSGLLLRFFALDNPIILLSTGHEAHFGSQPAAEEALRQLNRGIATQISTFPLGSSSSGFTYTFDPALGVFTRSSDSFGPIFAERALTAGKGKLNFGVNYVHATYDTFEGQNLDAGDIQLILTHQDVNGDSSRLEPYYEGDLIRANLFLKVSSDTAAFFASYGISDHFDVGLAVPYVSVKIDARIHETILPISTGGDSRISHLFPDGALERDVRQTGSAEGIGDIVLRAKYNFHRGETLGLAAGADLRLPTGDENELLGSGATQAKLYAIASGSGSTFSPHANIGYTFSWGGSIATGDLPDEINYTVGFDAALGRRLTLMVDMIGRTLRNTGRLVVQQKLYDYSRRDDPIVRSVAEPDLQTVEGDLNVILASAGIRFNPVANLLISANALISTGNRGLQDKFTPVVAIDYSF